jgi:tripartite-type tricarboxylate transporter receptor subunit TctC
MSDRTSPNALRRALLLAAPASVLPWGAAQAQAFPSRPFTLICPWPAGGSTDRHLRVLAEAASKVLGQPVVVENRAGGGGTLGPASMAASSRPDGYTLSQFPMGMLRLPHMQKVGFNPLNDFTFIIGVTGYTFGLVVRADAPWKTLPEFLEAARKAPGQIPYGSTGNGTTPHLLVEELAQAAKVQLNHIPYKGNADQMQALLGGHIQAASDATGWDKFVEAGQMRLLATFGEARTQRWPNVPTAKELGLGVVANSPYGIAGPKGMEPAVVKALHDAFKKAMDDPKHVEVLQQLNQAPWYQNSDDYRNWAVAENGRAKVLIERLGLAAK